MDVFILLYIVTVAFTGVTGQHVDVDPKVFSYFGRTVNLSCVVTGTTASQIFVVQWLYGNTIIAELLRGNEPNYPESPLSGRVNFSSSPPDPTSPSIQIRDVKKTDEGNYTCATTISASAPKANTTYLEILEPVSNVKVTANSTDLVEFSSVRLSCSSSGSSPSFLWLNSSSNVTATDRVHITDGGSTLTIVHVTRYDQGPFKCHVFNNFSNDTSDPELLSISFGPENTHLIISPSQVHYEEGSDISLNCSADSRPTAQFTWFLNKEPVAATGSELSLMNVKQSHSGNYSCQASNIKTMRSETSQPSVISVLKKIVNASVTHSNQPVEGNSVNLTCEAAGSVFTRKWMKNGADLTESDNLIFYNEGRVLSFLSLNKTDNGKYSCNLSNPFSSDEAEYNMIINFGPENVQIRGLSNLIVCGTLTLTCSAESTPPPSFTWKLNGIGIRFTSAVLEKDITDVSESGKYTCEVMNSITGRTSSAVHELTVSPGPHCHLIEIIVGTVMGCVCLTAVCVVLFVLHKKKKLPKKCCNRDTGTRAGGEDQNNATTGNQDLNYADVKFVRNRDGGMVDLGAENNTSEYAQVRVSNMPAAASCPPTYDTHMQKRTAPVHPSGANGAQQYAHVRK